MRLAEAYHRQPVILPSGTGPLGLEGMKSDNANIIITHSFPAPDKGCIGIRVLNASSEIQDGTFNWPNPFVRVETADLDGRLLPFNNGAQLALSQSTWRYRFRPWEIVTFCIVP
jgi:hypothetical protein